VSRPVCGDGFEGVLTSGHRSLTAALRAVPSPPVWRGPSRRGRVRVQRR
jgi:hypothetical protein